MSPVQSGSKGASSRPKDRGEQRKTASRSDNNGTYSIPFEVYMAEARAFQGIGEFRKAIISYTKALEVKQTEKRCQIGRAECYYSLGQAEKSLADAIDVLKRDKNYVKGLLMTAESYYHLMQFENALLYFHRGHKRRPEIQQFRLGIQKCEEAIENCIGESAGRVLESSGDMTYFYEEQECQKSKREVVYFKKSIGNEREMSAGADKQERMSVSKNSKTCKQLLGELFEDKEYLEKLLVETGSFRRQTDANRTIRSLAEGEVDYLNRRTEFWHQQRPDYIKQEKARSSSRSQQYNQDQNHTHWLIKKLEEIENEQTVKHHENCLTKSLKVLSSVKKWSVDDQEKNEELIANLHGYIGNAYLETNDHAHALEHHNMDYDLSKRNNAVEGKSRALDNLGRVYARMENYEKAVEIWEEKLPLSSSSLEKTWLYHELGRCHLELGQFEKARDYGGKSEQEARQADDALWRLNATVLIAQAQVKLGESEAALESFQSALALAQSQEDGVAETAIRSAMEDIKNSSNSATA